MKYSTMLSAIRSSGSPAIETERLIADCVRIRGSQCGQCPMTGSCVLHRRLLKELRGGSEPMALTSVQFEVDGEHYSAHLIGVAEAGASYRVSGRAHHSVVTAPLDAAKEHNSLSRFLAGQVRIGGTGMALLVG